VTAADRSYGEFYGFYSVSPENFGSTHVRRVRIMCWITKAKDAHSEHVIFTVFPLQKLLHARAPVL